MTNIHDYESLAYIDFIRERPDIMEAYDGKSIVRWYGKIENQLGKLLADAEKSRNFPYADKLREFQKIWRSNEITGSINREVLDTLKAASDMLAVDNWNLNSYFRSLRDELRVLVASEEELPRGSDMEQNDPYAGGGGGGGRGGPPMSPDFGPGGSPSPDGTADSAAGPDTLAPTEGAPGAEENPPGPGEPNESPSNADSERPDATEPSEDDLAQL